MTQIKMAGPSISDLEKNTVAEMMNSGWDNYEYVERFEAEFSAWHGRKYALMTPCCTHAIHLILLALGITHGDEVIVPECSWTASAAPITYCNATPVFADIDQENWCLSPASVERKISNKTKAIIAVDLYGNMPDMEGLIALSEKYNVPLIEDAAEALGSKLNGVRAGKFGVAGVHSFHRTKTMTTGEGGCLLIDDDELYERAKFLRDHGRSSTIPYYTLEATPKYMPSNFQGAMAWAQFQRVDELVDRKRHFLTAYKQGLRNVPDLQFNVDSETVYNGAWATSVVFGRSHRIVKATAIEELAKLNIPSRPFFYPLSSLPAYAKFATGSNHENPVAYDVSNRGITIAGHYDLTDEQINIICDGIRAVLNR
jgi:perosamine synthetase